MSKLDKVARSGEAKIEVSILRNGKAQIKEFLVDGLPWKQHDQFKSNK